MSRLVDYYTNEIIGTATAEQIEASFGEPTGTGAILIDGDGDVIANDQASFAWSPRTVYVESD